MKTVVEAYILAGGILFVVAAGYADRLPECSDLPSPENAPTLEDDRPGDIVTASILTSLREFHGKNGKVVRGQIHAYNPDSDTATIAREDGRKRKVKLDTLTEADQAGIREWHRLQEFFSQNGLRMSVKLKRVKSERESWLLKEQIWRRENTEDVVYEIELENRTRHTLPDLTLAYRIHSKKGQPTEPQSNDIEILKTGMLDIGTLEAGQTVELKTETIPHPGNDPFDYYTDDGTMGMKVRGIRVRVFLPIADGKRAMREMTVRNIH